jgi:DNA-binding NarL/FixJ family response regulator
MSTPTRILIADDHAVVRDGLRALLEANADLTVLDSVANGREAVAAAARLAPDIVLMDIAMPELNGIEATREILRRRPDARVIILSMHATSEHLFRVLEAGALGYLLKDAAGQEVVQAVRTVREGRRYLSQSVASLMATDYLRRGAPESPLGSLSDRERQILQQVVEGRSSADIAHALSLSPKTVETYRSRLMQKLGVADLPALIRFAIQNGLTPLD